MSRGSKHAHGPSGSEKVLREILFLFVFTLRTCRSWAAAVAWLQDELDRKYPPNSQYAYNTWSPPAQSNESSNGYFLERSNSAKKTLERALELMPEAERVEDEGVEDPESQEEAGHVSDEQTLL